MIINYFNDCKILSTIENVDYLIGVLKNRGYKRDRLFRKLVEEMGEYSETLEMIDNFKKEKLKGRDPNELAKLEICDVIMDGFALAETHGLKINDVLEIIREKINRKEKEYWGKNG